MQTETRTANAKRVALAPFYLACIVVAMAYMVATVPVLFVCVVVLLGPSEVLWALSPLVGIASPRAGHGMASFMDPACDALTRCIDVLWAPLDRLL